MKSKNIDDQKFTLFIELLEFAARRSYDYERAALKLTHVLKESRTVEEYMRELFKRDLMEIVSVNGDDMPERKQ